jgi:hypothetical protein
LLFKLVKSGYGSLKELKEADVREVMQALHYEEFCGNYEAEYVALNRGE